MIGILKRISKKQSLVNRKLKKIYEEIYSERGHYCTGCGTSDSLTHSHIIPRSRRSDLIIEKKNINAKMIHENIEESDISDATVILFWFTDEKIIKKMIKKFEKLKPETKIITIWGPLPNYLPDKVNFPYIINKVPFKKAENLQEQLLAVFGVKCIDFVTAWEFAERYTKSISSSEVKNDRFLTIIQTLIIWINAKELGVVCTEEIPESIKTYISIMKMHFDIDFEYLLK